MQQSKIAIQFSKPRKVTRQYQKLNYCKSCHHYSALAADHCDNCGRAGTFITLETFAKLLNANRNRLTFFILFSLVLLSILFADTISQLILTSIAGVVILFLYILLNYRYREANNFARLHEILIYRHAAIRESLTKEIVKSKALIDEQQYKEAYERLREITPLINNDAIKQMKLTCLNKVFIRKDMTLELETLMPSRFSHDFVYYLYEVSKVNFNLIRESVIKYVIIYREDIALLPFSKELFVNIASASIRMKHYIIRYHDYIAEFLQELPKERFLRLCRLMATMNANEAAELKEKCKEHIKNYYGFDPDFNGIL